MMGTKRGVFSGAGRVNLLLLLILLGVFSVGAFAESGAPGTALSISTDSASGLGPVVDVQKYNRSIHVLAMLLVGFGFLMVFVRRYGRSALTATYLLVSVSIPVYFLLGGIGAFVIGVLAGVLSVFGFAVVQSRLEQKVKGIDTCGVMNLHGWPGLAGGIAALFLVRGISRSTELAGIGITIAVALIAGYVTGKILSIFGRRIEPYVDSEEFVLE